jgi:hypothetical protein
VTRKPPTAEREYGFKRRVKLGKSKHSWESHADAGTLLKDVLHWLELLAANEPGRFVFIKMPTLLQKCNARRIKNKLKPSSLSNLKHIFVLLHDLHIASPRFTTWDGRDGFIFEPHDARCSVERGVCIKHTYTSKQLESMRKNWPSEKEACEQLLRMYGSTPGSTGVALKEHRCSTAVALPVAPSSDFRSTVRGTLRSTAEDVKPTDCEELTDEQVAEWMAQNAPDAASKVSKVISFEGSKVMKVMKEGDQEQDQAQEQVRGDVSLEDKPTTAEARAKAQGRRNAVLTADEFAAKNDADGIEQWKAEIAVRPTCPKCGVKHLGDACVSKDTGPKRKK